MKSNYSIFFTLPVLWYLSYTFYKHLEDRFYMSYIDTVDFVIHEFGHLFFAIFWNEFLMIAWWSLMQLIIPLAVFFLFLSQRDYFGVAFTTAWIGTNFFYISMYAWDAIRLDLPLVSLWKWEVIHDWNYLFWESNLILHTNLISEIFYFIAIILYIIWLSFWLYLIVNRWK